MTTFETVFAFAALAAAAVEASIAQAGSGGSEDRVSFSVGKTPESSGDIKDLRFLLYTRENPLEAQILDMDNVAASNYHTRGIVKFLVHDYASNGSAKWIQEMKDAILKHGDSSVVVVDWGKLAASWPFLEQAAFNVVPVAAQVAKLIKRLREYHQVCIREFYPIGLGIGAHLAGHISIALNRRLARVTGLDPLANPHGTDQVYERLNPDVADFVDVIHTTGSPVGIDKPLGDADFFPNSGEAPQPGCEDQDKNTLQCSHERSAALFSESFENSVKFYSVKCDSWDQYKAGLCNNSTEEVLMGYQVNFLVKGTYYLETNAHSPYAKTSASG